MFNLVCCFCESWIVQVKVVPQIKPRSCFPLVLFLFPRKNQDWSKGQWHLPKHWNSMCAAHCVLLHFPISVSFPSPAMVSPFLPFLVQLWLGSWAQQHSRKSPETLSAPAKVMSPAKSPLLIWVLGSRFGMRFSFPLERETTAKGKASNSFSY